MRLIGLPVSAILSEEAVNQDFLSIKSLQPEPPNASEHVITCSSKTSRTIQVDMFLEHLPMITEYKAQRCMQKLSKRVTGANMDRSVVIVVTSRLQL